MRPDLIAASFIVLRKNKQLMIFPFLSSIAALVTGVAFLSLALLAEHPFDRVRHLGYVTYPILFAWYCISAFGVIFFNCALAACAQEHFAGGQPTVGFGLRRAVSRVETILLWAIITSTVGIILRMIERRVPLAGKIAVWLVGGAWGMTTYLVVPVMIAEDRSAIESLRRSAQLLRDTWGTQLTAGIRFGWRFLLLAIPGVIAGAIGANYYLPFLPVAVIYLVGLLMVLAAANGIFEVALYRYAAGASVPNGWSNDAMSSAFRPSNI